MIYEKPNIEYYDIIVPEFSKFIKDPLEVFPK